MGKLLTIVISVFIVLSCSRYSELTDKTNFEMDIPDTSKFHRPDYSYEIIKHVVDELSFPKLEQGADTFELRLWTKVGVTNGGQVHVIKKIKDNWTCFNYFFLETHKEWENGKDIFFHLTNFTIDTFWVRKINPKSGWATFFKRIEEQKIYELPDQREINGWENTVTDGFIYDIEFATTTKYKFYSYHCPDVYEDKFIECKRMTKILDIFNEEFGYTVFFNEYRCISKK